MRSDCKKRARLNAMRYVLAQDLTTPTKIVKWWVSPIH